MPSEETLLAPQFDGVSAVLRALVTELASKDETFRQRLAQAAAADIRERTKTFPSDAARNVMLAVAATTCGVPIGRLAGQ